MERMPAIPIPHGKDGESWMGVGINVDGAMFGGVGELHEPITPEQIEQVARELAQGIGQILLHEGIIGGQKKPEQEPPSPSSTPDYGEA